MLEMFGAELPTWEEDVEQYFAEPKVAEKLQSIAKQNQNKTKRHL